MTETDQRRLPLRFRALDVEARTRRIPVVECPDRQALTPLGVCGYCPSCARIEFRAAEQATLTCVAEATSSARHRELPLMRMLRAARVCAACDTQIETLLPHLVAGMVDTVPVLDHAARPLGALSATEVLHSRRAGSRTNGATARMFARPIATLPLDATLARTAQLFAITGAAHLIVTSAAGTYVGLVSLHDLATGLASDTTATSLLATEPRMKPVSKILVPIDFSEQSPSAVDFAADLARRYEASLHLVHVHQPLAYTLPETTVVLSPDPREGQFAEIDLQLQAFKTRARATGVLQVETQIARGHPVSEIVRCAKEGRFDLIVMGTHGRTGIEHVLIGSVAENVVRTAPCPVVTLR